MALADTIAADQAAVATAQAALDAANAQAEQAYTAAKAQIVLWKAGQVKAIGGDPWKRNSQGVQFVKFPGDDGVYGTMDGVNWVNIKTGYPSGGG